MGEDQTSNDMIQLIEIESLVIHNFSCVCGRQVVKEKDVAGFDNFVSKLKIHIALSSERASVPICGRAHGLGPFTRSVVKQMGPG